MPLMNRYASFMKSGACLPQNGHDPNIYLLICNEQKSDLSLMSLLTIQPFNQAVHVFGSDDNASTTRFSEILHFIGMHLKIKRFNLHFVPRGNDPGHTAYVRTRNAWVLYYLALNSNGRHPGRLIPPEKVPKVEQEVIRFACRVFTQTEEHISMVMLNQTFANIGCRFSAETQACVA